MRDFTIKAALSALLVAAPLAGAFAEDDRSNARDGHPYIDESTTQAIEPAGETNFDLLETALSAAETNLETGALDSALTEAEALEYRAQLDAIRQAAVEERDASGDLSPASYEMYYNQILALQEAIGQEQAGG